MAIASKDDVIRGKDETINALKGRIEDLEGDKARKIMEGKRAGGGERSVKG